MPAKINLLPVELGISRESIQANSTLKKIIVGVASVFLLGSFFGIGYFLILTNQLNSEATKNNNLKQSIKALEATEQRILLVKDRARKAGIILGTASASGNLSKMGKILASLPADITLDEAGVDSSQGTFSVFSANSSGVISFLNALTNSGSYTQVFLKNFSFNPVRGYLITIEAN